MAEDKKKPPDRMPGKVCCHPQKKVSVVVCLICDSVYNRSDYNSLNKQTYLSDVLIICDKHDDLDLTSKVNKRTLNDSAKKIIAQIKAKKEEQVKEEIMQNISVQVDLDGSMLNESAIGANSGGHAMALKNENLLLRQLNSELLDKNKLLKDIVNRRSELKESETYASVAAGKINKHNKKVSDVIIKSAVDNENMETYNEVVKAIQKHVVYPINKTIKTKKGLTIIRCKNGEDVLPMIDTLKEKFGNRYEVTKERIRNPRLKVVNMENNMNKEELETDINERNFNFSDSKCVVQHMYGNKKKSNNAYIELTGDLYAHVKNNGGFIYVGHEKCKVYDDFNLNPCFRCGGYGHSSKSCRHEETCLKCGQRHSTIECKEESFKCLSCIRLNSARQQNCNVDHKLTDTKACEFLKDRLSKIIAITDYPVKPDIPNLISMILEDKSNGHNSSVSDRRISKN